jgi:hypothetical protein
MTYVYDMPLTQYRVQQEYSATMAIVGLSRTLYSLLTHKLKEKLQL